MNIFEKDYFIGNTISAYEDYSKCQGVLEDYSNILNTIFTPKSIFDGGCAYGFSLEWFNNRGITAYGCDVSEWAISHSKYAYKSSLIDIPEQDNSYELVTSTEVLEHIPEGNIKQVISELYRISNKYVVLLIAMAQSKEDEDKPDPGDSTHITMKTRQWWEKVIEDLGYTRDLDKENQLNNHQYSVQMHWQGRFFCLKK